MKPDIYLDAEGVIFTNGRPANYSREFMKYIVPNFPTFWIINDLKKAKEIDNLALKFEPEMQPLVKRIKPTNWEVLRIEAIDLNRPFLWFGKNLNEREREILDDYGVLRNWVEVDFSTDENRLADFLLKFPRPVGYDF